MLLPTEDPSRVRSLIESNSCASFHCCIKSYTRYKLLFLSGLVLLSPRNLPLLVHAETNKLQRKLLPRGMDIYIFFSYPLTVLSEIIHVTHRNLIGEEQGINTGPRLKCFGSSGCHMLILPRPPFQILRIKFVPLQYHSSMFYFCPETGFIQELGRRKQPRCKCAENDVPKNMSFVVYSGVRRYYVGGNQPGAHARRGGV